MFYLVFGWWVTYGTNFCVACLPRMVNPGGARCFILPRCPRGRQELLEFRVRVLLDGRGQGALGGARVQTAGSERLQVRMHIGGADYF